MADASLDQLKQLYMAADKAGDAATARAALQQINAMSGTEGGISGSVTDAGPKPVVPALPPPEGYLGTAVRALANGATAGWADKIAAGVDSVIPLDAGSQSIWGGHSISDAYAHNRDQQLAQTQSDAQAHPVENIVGNVGGALMSPIAKLGMGAGSAMGGVRGAIASGAAAGGIYGGIYGAGQSQAPTWTGEAADTAQGAIGGALGGAAGSAIASGAGALARGVADPVKQAMYKAGVRFTPGQAIGGTAENIEGKLSSLPFMGSQINSRLSDSGAQWNTATINRALEPYGTQLPEGVTGSDAFAYGQKAVDGAFDKARSGLIVSKNPDFDKALGDLTDQVHNGGIDALPSDYAKRFQGVVDNNVLRKFDASGNMNPQDYTKAASDIRAAARKQMMGQNPADAQEYGSALNKLADVLDSAALKNPQSDPSAVSQLQKARDGYRLWALAQGAADRGGSGTAGQFTPSQYLAEVEKGDQTVRNHAFTEGRAFDQQYGQDALNALGKRLPNSFTADRLLAAKMLGEGALGLGGSAAGLGHAALALPAADAVGAGIYSKPVNAMTNKLMFGGGPIRAKVGQKLNDLAPRAGQLLTGVGAVNSLGIQSSTP